jgi:O-acetyl-ADP-ribose deacetylase (regulator of RNase III)
LPNRAIVHVAGIDGLWRASADSIRGSVRSAVALVLDEGFRSVAFPVIGAGSGGFDEDEALEIMLDTLSALRREGAGAQLLVRVVRFGGHVTVEEGGVGVVPGVV